MGGHKTIRGTSYEKLTPAPPVPWLTVIGDPPGTFPDPDCRGDYYKGGSLNGEFYYPRMDNAYYIWYSIALSSYVISTLLGVPPTDYWINHLLWPEGVYLFMGDYIGDVLVIDKVWP